MGSDEVRRWAVQIQQIGDDVRRSADRTLTADAIRWRSTAAASFRRRLAEETARVRFVAVELDRAAEALLRHAVAVDGALGGFDNGGSR
jgi:hypothetical protein